MNKRQRKKRDRKDFIQRAEASAEEMVKFSWKALTEDILANPDRYRIR